MNCKLRAVAENLIKIKTMPVLHLESFEDNFLKRFSITNGKLYYDRPVPFGVKRVHVENLTRQEFNKLHIIANPSSHKH